MVSLPLREEAVKSFAIRCPGTGGLEVPGERSPILVVLCPLGR